MKIKHILLCCAGFFLLILGIIGAFLPVLPTTPFVLAASGCFASTPKIYNRMMRIPFFKDHIQNYRDKQGLSRKTVTVSLAFLWGMLLLSALHIGKIWSVIIFGLIGTTVTIHILWMAKARK